MSVISIVALVLALVLLPVEYAIITVLIALIVVEGAQ